MFKHPLFTKLAALAAITVLLLFGLGMIENVVRDRLRYRSLTAQSVADSLAGPQTLMGPLIHSACVESWDVETGKGDERRMVEQRREFLLTGNHLPRTPLTRLKCLKNQGLDLAIEWAEGGRFMRHARI